NGPDQGATGPKGTDPSNPGGGNKPKGLTITQADVTQGGNKPMTFLKGAQGTTTQGQTTPTTVTTLASVADLKPSDFPQGGKVDTTSKTGAGSLAPDPQGSKVSGGVSLDDKHGPKTVQDLLKPNS